MLKTIFVNLRNIFLVAVTLYIFYYGYILYIAFGPMNVPLKKNDDQIKEISLAKGTIHLEEKKEIENRYYKQLSYKDAYGKISQISTDPWHKYNFKVSPDKKKVAYITQYSVKDETEYSIQIFNEETGTMTTLCKNFSWCDEINWSPDSKTISFIFSKNGQRGGAVIDIHNDTVLFMETIKRSEIDFGYSHSSFSPIVWMNSPKEIIYSSKGELTIYNLSTKRKKVIDHDVYDLYFGDRGYTEYMPSWKIDNRFIVYAKGKEEFVYEPDYTSVYDNYLGLTTNIPVVK